MYAFLLLVRRKFNELFQRRRNEKSLRTTGVKQSLSHTYVYEDTSLSLV